VRHFALAATSPVSALFCRGGGGNPATGLCTGGKGALVTARYSVDPALWNSVISVAVANVGGILVGTTAPLGGYGTGYGGIGIYTSASDYGSGGGGGSSVQIWVSVLCLSFPGDIA
jgi:hypothetical protein